MKKNSTGLFCCLLIILINFQNQPVFKKLKELSGTWRAETSAGVLFETWSLSDANQLIGSAYRLASGDTVLLEKMQLSEKDDEVFYTPLVKEQNEGKAVPFKLVSAESGRFVFENKSHDFPKQIIYQLVGKDSVHAWITGEQQGRRARMDYFYQRVAGTAGHTR